MKRWGVIVGILILGLVISSGCTQPASSPSTSTPTSIQPTPLGTEQTLQPTPQPTAEVTKTPELPLPLTQTYLNDECQFSLKIPDGWVVVGGKTKNSYGIQGIYYKYYIVTSKFAQDNPQLWKEGWPLDWQNTTNYRSNAAVIIEPWLADDYKWRWIVNGLRDDPNGNTYWKTYDKGTIVEDVLIGNSIKSKKMTLTNTTDYSISSENWNKSWKKIRVIPSDSPLSEFMPYCDVRKHSEGEIDYVTMDRTTKGYMFEIDYGINPQINDKPIETFSPATYDEIIKSFKMEKA